ncbi:MAG: MFS transporter [Pseudomonadota bacterium]
MTNRTETRAKMWNRNFLLLWQGQIVSQIGTQLFSLALLYWVLETTGSATLMGLILMAAALPGALLGPFAGTLADNFSRKWLMVWSDVVRGLVALAFVYVLWWGESGWALPTLFAAQVIFGICNSIFTPAVNATIPELVTRDRLTSANSLLQGANSLTTTASFSLGGFLYAAVGAAWLFAINGISYLLSALSESFIRVEQKLPNQRMSRSNALAKFRHDTWEGILYVWGNRGLRILVGMLALINFVLVPTAIGIPILVKDFLGRGPEFLGIMGACQALGSLVGFIVMAVVKIAPAERPYIILLGMVASGGSIVLLGLTTIPLLTLPVLALFGFTLPLINVNIISLMQGTTPSATRGRVMGVMATVVLGLIPLSQGISGIVIDALDQNIPAIYVAVGLAFVALVLTSAINADFRRYLATDYSLRD